ncbi:MAG: PAS domain S-box protein [Wenzhouxiangellaceae bacterium]
MASTAQTARLPEREMLLDALPDAIVIVDRDGRIVLANEQTLRLFSYSRAELIGQAVEMLVPEGMAKRHFRMRQAHTDSPRPRPLGALNELCARHRNGTEFPVEISLGPVHIDQDLMTCATIRDVSEKRLAQSRLMQQENALKELKRQLEAKVARRTAQLQATMDELQAFSYSVSHDLRAPLRAIDGFSRVLQRRKAEQLDTEAMSMLGRIRGAATRMATLIDQLLSLARISRQGLQRRDVNLSSLATELGAELAAGEPGRKVRWNIQSGLLAHADPALMRSVLSNLLGNAWKFTAHKDEVLIEFGQIPGDGSGYFVRDNGAGFDMRYADKLFGAFQRLHSEHEFPGSGIGLATAQRVIHRHGGRIWAEGVPDEGASFYFTVGRDEDNDDD